MKISVQILNIKKIEEKKRRIRENRSVFAVMMEHPKYIYTL